MATLTLGYKIWDSTDLLSCCSGSGDNGEVVRCGGSSWNPRGAQLIPNVNCDTGTIRWDLHDNLNEYAVVSGSRDGIAVTNPDTGEITLWDVDGSSSQTVQAKLLVFLPICNCEDCEGALEELDGYYQCDYPDVPQTTYCYNVAVTSNNGTNNELRLFAMRYNAYMTAYPQQTVHAANGTTTTYRICIDRPIAQIGNAANETWTLV